MLYLRRGRKSKGDRLIQEEEDENGVSNPAMETETNVLAVSGGESSAAEMTAEEAEEAEHLIKDLKKKHRRKQKELEKVKSPKDDLARELKTVKKRSKAKVDETLRQEEEELAALEAAEDGTLPMPAEEAEGVPTETTVTFAEPVEGEEGVEDKVKRLRKKIEKAEEEEVSAFEPPPETPRTEPEPAPEEPTAAPTTPTTPAPPTPAPEEEAKTPRTMSMKARMKDRLKKAKEEAEAKVEQEAQEERRERRLQRDKQQKATRFDTEMDEAEMERLADERQKQLKVRWKKMGREKEDRGVFMPTAEEAYDFFTREFEPEPEEEKPAAKVEEEKEKKEGEEEEEEKEKEEGEEGEKPEGEEEEKEEEDKKKKKEVPEDEEPLLDADDLDEEGFGMYVWRRAEYDDSKETYDKMMAMLYYPEISTVPPEEKVFGEEQEPRFLEEEGFYVGVRPKMSGWNLNKMEHRLLKERESKLRRGGGDWFGEDGRMLALPDPLRPTPSRPPIPEEPEEGLQVEFHKAIMREFDSRYIDGSIDGSGFYQLDVDINSVAFSHHHLFSKEHVLANKLTELYEEYLKRKNLNMAEYLTEKLKTAKNSALHLREHMLAHKADHDYADRSNFERRLQDYKYQIKTGRELRDKEQRRDRELLKQIINVWKELKAQRQRQNHTNTPEKLTITKEDVDKERDQMLWKMEIEDELEEIRDEHEEEYQRRLTEYNNDVKAREEQQTKKKEALARKKKRERAAKGSKASLGSRASKLSGDHEPSPEEIARDEEIINEPDYPVPEKPDPMDEQVTRDQIVAKAKEIRRRPGEPKLTLELTNTQTITPTQNCPRGEQSRRDDVSKCKIFLKILFNNKEVSRSNAKPLNQEFKVNFGQIFNLKIVQWPESIKVQLFEQRGFGTEMLADIDAKIPDASVTSASVHLEELDVVCNNKVNHPHEGIGSGILFPIPIKGLEQTTLTTKGKLSCSVGWAVDENGVLLVPPSSQLSEGVVSAMRRMEGMADPIADLGLEGVNDPERVAKWLDEKRIDPNDPKYADLFYNFKSKSSDPSMMAPVEYFRLEQLQQEFDFCEDDYFEENKRFKLIRLRDEEVQEFKNFKMVPLQERDIHRDTFLEYDRKKRDEEKVKEEKDIESHRQNVSKFMQRVREQVIRRFRRLAHQKRLEDVVSEDAVPNIAMIGTSLLKLTERRRPLRVERKERKKVSAQNLRPEDVSILVSITRAIFVPTRSAGSSQHGGTTARGDETTRQVKNIVGDTQVQPFVEVMFQHVSMRTSVGSGPNPSFNEELKLPFNAPNEDYSPGNLQQINENIYLNLFDEVVVDIQEDDRQRETTVHKRIEKKWLGSLTIPFSTVYFNGKIEGTFKLDKPPVLLGYSTGDDDEEGAGLKRKPDTYITLFVTIEPALQTPEPMKERFTTNESENLLQYAEKWQTELNTKFPKREYKPTVIDVNGKTVFVTRYLKALEPPQSVIEMGDNDTTKAEFVARFVSLIPSVSDNVVFPGLCDIWSTCDQFLQWMTGDEEEHAVLLANYFLHMGKPTWLVIGTAIPEGPTAYVLTKEERHDDFWFWNAGTGEHFSKRDAYCPLQTVGCVINQENIWGNIQQYQKPSQMTFDLQNKSAWKPFFHAGFRQLDLSSCQPLKLYYKDTNTRAVNDLQEKIEQLLKNKIMEWRSRQITRWNRHCTQIMRRLLPNLEKNVGKTADPKHLDELEQSFGSYKVSGFPINLAYSEISSITEAVYSTGVHMQESSDVEFALAVYVHPYPNDVLSVWVYVASMMRIR